MPPHYEPIITPRAARGVRALGMADRQLVDQMLTELSADPRRPGVCRLKDMRGAMRYRRRHIRIIYRIDEPAEGHLTVHHRLITPGRANSGAPGELAEGPCSNDVLEWLASSDLVRTMVGA